MTAVAVQPKPLAGDLRPTLEASVAHAGAVGEFVTGRIDRIDRVYLIGCGGSFYSTFPAHDLIERSTTEVAAAEMTSAELTARLPKGLDERALVVASSHSGATPETVEAARVAAERGASVIGIARQGDCPLARVADLLLDYPSDVTVTEPKAIGFLLVALAIVEAVGDLADPKGAWAAIAAVPEAVSLAKAEAEEVLAAAAVDWRDAPNGYVIGAGPNWGAANATAECYLQEMNWLHAAAVHAGDFFHGPFEIVGQRPTLVLVGEDQTRALAERAVAFTEHYYDRVAVIDSKQFTLPGVPDQHRSLIAPIAVASAARRFLDFVAAERGHDTTVRRYMYKVAY